MSETLKMQQPAQKGAKLKRTLIAVSASATVLLVGWGVFNWISGMQEPETSGGPATFRRLNEAQYKQSIADVFGTEIEIPGRFDPPLREEGLLAIGNSKVGVTPSGFEQYVIRAREISAQVMAESHRQNTLQCTPKSVDAFDESCARQFFEKYGRLLFRRPLTGAELASTLKVTKSATETLGSFYEGVEYGLAGLLVSPSFVFRTEAVATDPDNKGASRLDDYSLASRISFLLWDAPPDAELLDAAAEGSLRKQSGLEHQVDRLIESPRFNNGVRAFFSDMFAYDQFSGLAKDQKLFPRFTSQLAQDAQEQSLRTIVDLLVTEKGDYRDLFTTKKTFLNRSLGAFFKVDIDADGFDDGWMPHTFAADDQRAGLLTLPAFLMLDPSHEGRSSPTIRGKMVREIFLCQSVPAPPGDVNFAAVQETQSQKNPTARDRLKVHQVNPTCTGCHAITDPIGLGLENYDAIGQFRTEENGSVIDAAGSVDGKDFKDAITLQHALTDNPKLSSCLVKRVYEYGVGHAITAGERAWSDYLTEHFTKDNYQLPALMRRIATSKAFQTIKADVPAAGVNTLASAD